MRAFWAQAGRHWPLSLPRRRMAALVGSSLDALLGAGVLVESALRDGDMVGCTCGGVARVVVEGRAAIALCDLDDEVEDLGPPSRLSLDIPGLAQHLAFRLELEGSIGRVSEVQALGTRLIGRERVAFDLIGRPARDGLTDCVERRLRDGPSVRVLLVPDGRRLPADQPRQLAGVELLWLGLDRLLPGPELDLNVLAERFPTLVPKVPELELRGERVWWGGAELPLGALGHQLLRMLAQRRGEVVTRRELWRELWPGDHLPDGRRVRGVNPDDLDRRLRTLVAEVRVALPAALQLGNIRGEPERGGYFLKG